MIAVEGSAGFCVNDMLTINVTVERVKCVQDMEKKMWLACANLNTTKVSMQEFE